jgi:hypothetical protein
MMASLDGTITIKLDERFMSGVEDEIDAVLRRAAVPFSRPRGPFPRMRKEVSRFFASTHYLVDGPGATPVERWTPGGPRAPRKGDRHHPVYAWSLVLRNRARDVYGCPRKTGPRPEGD